MKKAGAVHYTHNYQNIVI